MRISWLRNALMATTGTAIVMLAGVGIWTLLGGSGSSSALEIPASNQSTADLSETVAKKVPMNFESLWNLTLQAPRTGSQAGKNTLSLAKPASRNIGGIQFLGAMTDSSSTLALFKDTRNAYDLKGVGESLDLVPAGARVTKIEPGIATLQFEGVDVALAMTDGSSATIGSSPITIDPDADVSPPSSMMPEELGMMTPLNPDEPKPEGEDIFAPLPPHMIPWLPEPVAAPGVSMEAMP